MSSELSLPLRAISIVVLNVKPGSETDYNKLFHAAAEAGDGAAVEHFAQIGLPFDPKTIMVAAATGGNPRVANIVSKLPYTRTWVRRRCDEDPLNVVDVNQVEDALLVAAKKGRHAFLAWARVNEQNQLCRSAWKIAAIAAENCDIRLLRFLCAQTDISWYGGTIALHGGAHLRVWQFLADNFSDDPDVFSYDNCRFPWTSRKDGPGLDVLKWLSARGARMGKWDIVNLIAHCEGARTAESIDKLRWLVGSAPIADDVNFNKVVYDTTYSMVSFEPLLEILEPVCNLYEEFLRENRGY